MMVRRTAVLGVRALFIRPFIIYNEQARVHSGSLHLPMRLLRFSVYLFFIGVLVFTYGSCNPWGLFDRAEGFIDDLVTPRTLREAYLRHEYRNDILADTLLDTWDIAYLEADTQRLRIALPHREVMVFDSSAEHSVRTFRFHLPAGRMLSVESLGPAPNLFAELYRTGRDGRVVGNPVSFWTRSVNRLTYEARRPGEDLLLLFQSVPRTCVLAEISLITKAALEFPVAGKDARAIKSFWGDSRDGGRRSHKGNDIFAPKGTPLVAVADGKVYKVANGGLGGKTVWLRDRARGQSYYYAHLDTQFVRSGQYVQRGDTLGTVGNTGNARTTPPHLHFGVYARGAYDPSPLLQPDDALPGRPVYELPPEAAAMAVPSRGSHYLRKSPERGGEVLRQLENEEAIVGLGATGRFYRVLTRQGELGYVNFD